MNSVLGTEPLSAKPTNRAIIAAMIAGACTFLNVYCTQPLLPFLQRLYHASEIEVALTVGAVTLAVAVMAPIIGMMAETIGRKKVIVRRSWPQLRTVCTR
jgi:MFS transporter, YNFM family, putative membrane transport protein